MELKKKTYKERSKTLIDWYKKSVIDKEMIKIKVTGINALPIIFLNFFIIISY